MEGSHFYAVQCPLILLPFWGYSMCLEILGKIPLKSSGWEKNRQNWNNTGLFLIGKQPVFGCKIRKIKSLSYALYRITGFLLFISTLYAFLLILLLKIVDYEKCKQFAIKLGIFLAFQN